MPFTLPRYASSWVSAKIVLAVGLHTPWLEQTASAPIRFSYLRRDPCATLASTYASPPLRRPPCPFGTRWDLVGPGSQVRRPPCPFGTRGTWWDLGPSRRPPCPFVLGPHPVGPGGTWVSPSGHLLRSHQHAPLRCIHTRRLRSAQSMRRRVPSAPPLPYTPPLAYSYYYYLTVQIPCAGTATGPGPVSLRNEQILSFTSRCASSARSCCSQRASRSGR